MQAMDRTKDTIICDLDGTIANDSHRAHFLHPKHKEFCSAPEAECVCGLKRDWDSYFAACGGDAPVDAVIRVIQAFWDEGYNIRLLTGRSESTRAETENWLRKYAVPYHTLVMRPIDNRTDDDKMKPLMAAANNWRPSTTLFVMEDRQRVVDAWRSLGYTVFQVAPGNF